MSNDIEWKMVKLGDVAKFLPTNTLSRDELNYSEGEYLNIHYGDVLIKFDSVTDVLNSEIPFVSLNKKFSDKSLLKNGDIVMADTAEDESVGKVTEIQNVGNNKVVSGLHTLCMRFQENLFAPKFAGYYLNSPAFHNLLLPYMHGTKVTSISKGDVKKIIFPIPYKNGEADLETQELIAQKLGDMDSLIAAKEKLLAKKRDLKIGAMQKLIKDEESENWKKVKLGEVIQHLRTGLNPRSNFELNPADANGYYGVERGLEGSGTETDPYIINNVSDLELINSIETEEPEKTFTQKIFDIFKSPETKEEETLKNQLDTANEEIVRLTNELESIKVANEANVAELKNKLDELENEKTELYNAIQKQKDEIEATIANEVNTRIAALGYEEEELAQPSNKLENTNIAEMVKKYGLDFALNYLASRR